MRFPPTSNFLRCIKMNMGAYPEPSSGYACLGEPSHYPRTAGWTSEGACYGTAVSGNIYPVISVDTGLNNRLRQYIKNLPDASYAVYEYGSSRYRGAQYFLSGPNGEAQIMYLDKEGDSDHTCAWGGTLYGSVGSGVRQCTIILR